MADREREFAAETESKALHKLQDMAGIATRGGTERLDWMYEQSSAVTQKTDDELMNTPVGGQKDKDVENVKSLGQNTAGSLFLRSATNTNEDTLRKLREDPLFQIRREEQAARESMMANPLIMARIKKKQEKVAKKEQKKLKKAAKKEKKAMKKAKKKAKKASKKAGSSSSSSSDSSSGANAGPPMATATKQPAREAPPRKGIPEPDLSALGPGADMVDKREQRAALVAERKRQALESRGAPRRMDEEEKRRRLEQMRSDAASHDKVKEKRIEEAEKREKEQEELEAKMRANSDQKYFREMREKAYMEDNKSMSDRLKNQRHRRQKGILDPLEKDR